MQTQHWHELYKRKRMTADEALATVNSGDRIALGAVGAEPQGILSRLHTIAARVQDVHLFGALLMGQYEWLQNPQYAGIFTHEAWFYGPAARAAHQSHHGATLVPNNLHRSGPDRYEVAPLQTLIATVSPMDRHGYFSLASAVYEPWVLRTARRIIVEVNRHAPRTFGDTLIHVSQVEGIVEHHAPLHEMPTMAPGPEEEAIAGHVAELVEDGATIQLGIGGIPNAVATFLRDKKELGVHTEMIVDAMLDLYEAGVVTNSRKRLDPGKTVGCFVLGSRRLYEWVNDNPGVEIRDCHYTNNPSVLAQQPRMTSINTAISVDLTGQVCSESIGPRQYSGTGGQRDTHVGAWMSEGGKGIICLRATARQGTISTIVPTLAPGSVVTMTRNDVDYVVTEYGVAHLRGRSIHERAAALIRIAHPDFRDALKEEAERQGWLPARPMLAVERDLRGGE